MNEDYKLEVCGECDYQWTAGSKPVHRESCTHCEEGNFFDSDSYRKPPGEEIPED